MKEKMRHIAAEVTGKEIFCFGMLGVAQGIVFQLWNGQMMFFYTDIFMLSPAFLSVLFLVARIWDGVNDPMCGLIIERTKTKYGRFKNAMIFAPLPLAVALALNFFVPSFKGIGMYVYVVVTYLMFDIVYTFVDVSYFSLPVVMTENQDKRSSMFGIARLATGMTTSIVGILIVPCVMLLGRGDMKSGYFLTALAFGIISCLIYFLTTRHVHERYIPDKEKVDFKKTIRAIVQNKPLLMVMLFGFILQMITVGKSSLNMYYATYNLGNVMLASIVSLAGVPGMLIGSAVAPILIKKFEAKYVGIGITILFFLDSLGLFFFENNVVALMVNNLIFMFYVGAGMVIISTLTAETIEYADWKLGQRNEGFITSTQTFISKVAVAVANSGVLALIGFLGYVPDAEQTAGTLKAFFYIESIIPGTIGLLAIIPLVIYPLTKKEYARITEELKKRRAEKSASVAQ